MRRADIVGGVMTILFGIFAITQAAQLEYWSQFGPGPGFVPLWSSVIVLGGGILLFIQAVRKRAKTAPPLGSEKIRGLVVVGIVTLLTMVAALMMSYVGFTASMFIYVTILVSGIGKHRWHVGLVTGAITAVSFYVLFAKWLQVPLSKGIMGF